MTFRQLVKHASRAGVALILLAVCASASTVTFNTNAAGTGFGGTSLTLSNSLGAAATLTFVPDADTVTGVPSNINFGIFNLLCAACSTQAIGAGSFFDPFTFNLIVTDVTDGATGLFVGTSTGGTVFSDVSQITIFWLPLQIGPGTSNASSGDFGPTFFTTPAYTGIVAPNSGAVPGQTTVQAFVDSVQAVPEPGTLAMLGGSLLGLGAWRRRKRLTH
jgi:hypothetical protein